MYYDQKECGQRIKSLRIGRKLTQEEFAMAVFLNNKYISKIETGRASVSIEVVIRIADFFDVTIDYLLLGESTSKVQKEFKESVQLALTALKSIERYL